MSVTATKLRYQKRRYQERPGHVINPYGASRQRKFVEHSYFKS